jgi:hypothetical protein
MGCVSLFDCEPGVEELAIACLSEMEGALQVNSSSDCGSFLIFKLKFFFAQIFEIRLSYKKKTLKLLYIYER